MILRTILDLAGSRKNLSAKSSDLKMLQNKKLRSILIYAYDNVPFYHTRLKNAGIRPTDIQTVNDLDRIPLTTKKDIQHTPLSQMVANDVNIKTCVRSRTSGSTGLSLVTLASKRADDLDAVMWRRAFFKNGMRLRDKIVEIRDPRNFARKRWVEYFGILRTEYISIFDDVRTQAILLAKEKPDVIEGYPSSIEILTNFLGDKEKGIKPRLVFTRAELLDRRTRELIIKVFGAELFDYYGSSEVGLISWECKEHKDYHINADNLIMEFVNSDGETVAAGEQGEVVCTGLNNYVMPLIRYKQEDIGTAVNDTCACGITLPLMQITGGRKDDFLIATDGRVIPPTVFFPYPFESFEKIEQFRIIQEKKDKIRIQLVAKQSLDAQVLERATREVQKLFGKEMQVEFEYLKEIRRETNGKLRKIISQLHKS